MRSTPAFQFKGSTDCCALIFSETWLNEDIPDTAISLQTHFVYRSDRTFVSGKNKGGGVCIYVNNSWCLDVSIMFKYCSPDIELPMLKCRPFYLPREFSAIFITAIYIQPQADTQTALSVIHQTTDPDAVFIIAGDVNQCKLCSVLPEFHQHVNIPTREQNTEDHIYKVKGRLQS